MDLWIEAGKTIPCYKLHTIYMVFIPMDKVWLGKYVDVKWLISRRD